MIRDDFLFRQIAALAAFVARLIGKKRSPEDALAEAQAAGIVGLDLDVTARLPASALIGLLTTSEGLDAERCLALGLGLALRSHGVLDHDPGLSLTLTTTALALIDAAITARPRLDDESVQHVLNALLGGDQPGNS